MQAEWRRTPPGRRAHNGFWPSPGMAKDHLAQHKQHQAPIETFSGVALRCDTGAGVNGTLSLSANGVRWSGRRSQEEGSRTVLSEMVDYSNRDETFQSWTVILETGSIKSASISEDRSSVVEIMSRERLRYELQFRNPRETSSFLAKLKQIENLDAPDAKREARARGRRSISLDDVPPSLLDFSEESTTDENSLPANANQAYGKGKVCTGMQFAVEEEEMRTLVRKYCSRDAAPEVLQSIADELEQRFGYKLDGLTNRDATTFRPVFKNEQERAKLSMAYQRKLRTFLIDMRTALDTERARVERETNATIHSGANGCFQYRCKVTDRIISPADFEQRYMNSLPKHEKPTQSKKLEPGAIPEKRALPMPITSTSDLSLQLERLAFADSNACPSAEPSAICLVPEELGRRTSLEAAKVALTQAIKGVVKDLNSDLSSYEMPVPNMDTILSGIVPDQPSAIQPEEMQRLEQDVIAKPEEPKNLDYTIVSASAPAQPSKEDKAGAFAEQPPTDTEADITLLAKPITPAQPASGENQVGSEETVEDKFKRALKEEEQKLHLAMDKALNDFLAKKRELERLYYPEGHTQIL